MHPLDSLHMHSFILLLVPIEPKETAVDQYVGRSTTSNSSLLLLYSYSDGLIRYMQPLHSIQEIILREPATFKR